MVLSLLVVLDEVVPFAAAADHTGLWLSQFGSTSLLAHSSSQGVFRLSGGSNQKSPGGGVVASVFVIQCPQKSRSIGLLDGFKDHHMRTCLLFVVRIISASLNRYRASSLSQRVPCPARPTSIRYLNPPDKILSVPTSRVARVESVSSIQ